MRILCLIMVGAFLLTIAIAENGDSQRVNDRPQASMVASRSLSQSRNFPWSLHRAAESSQSFTPSNGIVMSDNMASPAISVPQYVHREHKAQTPAEGSMILEPMHKLPSRPSWMDWIPDLFHDGPPPGPGPLIGPIDFPGLSRNLYIRHNEPLDDDTNHVVIHVINRQAPTYSPTTPTLAQLPLGNNQISYYSKNPSQHAGSFYSNPVKSPEIEFDTAQFPYKLVEGNPWKVQTQPSDDKEIKDKKSQYQFFDAPTEKSHEKFHFKSFSTTAKPFVNPRPSISWSQRFDGQPIVIDNRGGQHYGRSIESKGPVMFPTSNSTATPAKQEQTYAWHRKYGYQNNTKAASENVRTATANLRAKLAEITAANRRQVNRIKNASSRVSRTSDTSSRLPRNRFSHFDTVNDTQRSIVDIPEPLLANNVNNIGLDFVTREVSPRQAREYSPNFAGDNETQKSPVYIHKSSASEDEGALEVVDAPVLKNTTDASTGKKSDDVMQNIMSMTASQQWKNITSNLIETEKMPTEPMKAERRIDIMDDDEELTKESTTTTITTTSSSSTTTTTTTTTTVAPPVSTTNKTDKSKPNMEEAVERMMSSFTQWRYKVVSTNFLKELDSKEENESKQDR